DRPGQGIWRAHRAGYARVHVRRDHSGDLRRQSRSDPLIGQRLPLTARERRNNLTRLTTVLFLMATAMFAADPADAVREASNGWRQAAIKKDAPGLQRFLADDLAYAHSN